MPIEYKLLDESYKPSDDVDAAIQTDVQWVHQGSIQQDINGRDPIYLVDGVKFSDSAVKDGARVLGYAPGAKKIHHTDGTIRGYYDLQKPLEELTGDELAGLSKEGSNTLLRLNMLHRLQELVIDQ